MGLVEDGALLRYVVGILSASQKAVAEPMSFENACILQDVLLPSCSTKIS